MQQADIRKLKALLEEYATLLIAAGETITALNCVHVIEYIEHDLKTNQP